ncbi:hypothetical protein [Halodesulfovibrio spirochaetisodalis]|uniref:DUF5666 domain-containing protein n=1 Tax=Halodesulfovibrio spirochaetisodalis TaxID=1560234 RepID=A0A1B7XBK2_9BACT|nr:hypothetical protein [Halodesulfovibrio spirochaetisodalis]OBQ50102.1 hypothetical protein SP90_10675 [Halodesulfovibrio spirochaetisodalis]
MKLTPKLIVFILTFCLSISSVMTAYAGKDDHWPKVKGKIVGIDVPHSSVTIKNVSGHNMTFQIISESEIEKKGHGLLEWDSEITLSDLAVGQFVSVKYYGAGEDKVVRDMKVVLDSSKDSSTH